MKRNWSRMFVVLSLTFLTALGICNTAGATDEDIDGPVVLVAKPELRKVFQQTVLYVVPAKGGAHFGLIINRPTTATLGVLFPDHGPSKAVTDPVYFGGPVEINTLFAVVKRSQSPGTRSIPLAKDIYLVTEASVVDSIIEHDAANARFFAGYVVWKNGELEAEMQKGLWFTGDADVELLFKKDTDGVWEELFNILSGTKI